MRKPGITAVALAGAALLLLTGCTGRDTTSPSPSATIDATQLVASLPAATKSVDQVTWALVEGEPRSLVPGADYNFIAPNLCDSLLRVEPDFSIGEGIATKAELGRPGDLRHRSARRA